MTVLSILPHVEFGQNDHREDEPHFICYAVFIFREGKIADRIPIFLKVFPIVTHTPILPSQDMNTSVK